jgi:hypothetical protein
VVGGLVVGILADAIGFGGAIALVAALTALSGLWAALDLPAQRSPSAIGEPLEGA